MALWVKIVLGVLATGTCVWILTAAVRSGRPVRALCASGVQGLCALGLVNLSGAFTGVSLGVGWLSTGAGLVFGAPGIVALLLLKTVFPPV